VDAIDIELAEILAARLCHELVSPIGAISNGFEILVDEPDFAEDARTLIGQSTRQATRRLQFYRLAYGSTASLGDDLVRNTALGLFAEGRVSCTWPEGRAVPAGLHKLALNLLLVASEMLPRGGTVSLEAGPGLGVRVQGEGVRLGEGGLPLIAAGRDAAISPRTVQAIFTRRLAERLGLGIEAVDRPPDAVSLLAVS
jgi:histidine phosphotransferase ChpT